MAAQILSEMDKDMAASLHYRLARLDNAIDLLQGLRKETAELFAELFPEVA
jgi:hypothetical protein